MTFSNGDTLALGKYTSSKQTETVYNFSPSEPLVGLFGYTDSANKIWGMGMITYKATYCSSTSQQVSKISSVLTNRQIPVDPGTTSV
jgi:hypothetical protein